MTENNILSRQNTLWMQGVSALLIMLMHFVMQLEDYPRFFNIFGRGCNLNCVKACS